MLRVAHVLSETVTAADDDNDTIVRMPNNVSPMVGDRGVGDELTDVRDRWPPCVSRIVTVVVVVIVIVIIYYLSSPLTGYSSSSLLTSCYASIVVTVVVIAVTMPPKHGDWDWQLQVKELQN